MVVMMVSSAVPFLLVALFASPELSAVFETIVPVDAYLLIVNACQVEAVNRQLGFLPRIVLDKTEAARSFGLFVEAHVQRFDFTAQ